MATLYSVILNLDYLERAYVRGSVHDEEYTPACTRLLGQYKTVIKLVMDPSKPEPFRFGNLEAFMKSYDVCTDRLIQMDFPAAVHRLQLGVPATVEHASGCDRKAATQAKLIAETTQNFITLMDALKLRMRAKDQLHPLLGDLLAAYGKIESDSGETRAKLVHWLILLNRLTASEELDDADAREMLFDVEHAYNTWFKSLQNT
ncbi:Vacuolar protein-sorting-associated protein 28 [Malassezia yamatoensis]|uniref:Vacuolar protein sorting-associated protein 28 n=1 Tax=Malassezia yamatoensis TaxID=253288 RepID=A0AAJ5YSQ1_9BASI|nr:Vacuolar protein-sorting-associated protein 28 [Malassezia yamatoensis]